MRLSADLASEPPTDDRPVRVVLADDGAYFRRLVSADLDRNGFEVVAEASDLGSTLDAVRRHDPDVAVVDVRMPPTSTNEGLVVAHKLRELGSSAGVVLLTALTAAKGILNVCAAFEGLLVTLLGSLHLANHRQVLCVLSLLAPLLLVEAIKHRNLLIQSLSVSRRAQLVKILLCYGIGGQAT